MKTVELKLEISESILNSLNQDQEAFSRLMRLYSALQLFEEHKLSLGKAAELADLSRSAFMKELSNHGIPVINHDPADLEHELESFDA